MDAPENAVFFSFPLSALGISASGIPGLEEKPLDLIWHRSRLGMLATTPSHQPEKAEMWCVASTAEGASRPRGRRGVFAMAERQGASWTRISSLAPSRDQWLSKAGKVPGEIKLMAL
jgi:hypothetical protein